MRFRATLVAMTRRSMLLSLAIAAVAILGCAKDSGTAAAGPELRPLTVDQVENEIGQVVLGQPVRRGQRHQRRLRRGPRSVRLHIPIRSISDRAVHPDRVFSPEVRRPTTAPTASKPWEHEAVGSSAATVTREVGGSWHVPPSIRACAGGCSAGAATDPIRVAFHGVRARPKAAAPSALGARSRGYALQAPSRRASSHTLCGSHVAACEHVRASATRRHAR